ncbi:cartilage intermediate layer protein 2 [Kryptolebias marmoratus]|uniref:cartilage intermediate layer protein 2 n=1 Tax=Kryptolebias marmoratus TaxID=37003 RepID=UPI0007F9119C|nr:cartilage intermediate layer protein 2 [Kryptolebias marmoratus]
MIKQLSFTIAAVLLLGYIDLSYQDTVTVTEATAEKRRCWTEWFNRDTPGGTGDLEVLKKLREEYPGKICRRPREIQAVTADKEIPAERTKQKFYAYNIDTGFICRNEDQKRGRCFDYKVRFRCPCRSED